MQPAVSSKQQAKIICTFFFLISLAACCMLHASPIYAQSVSLGVYPAISHIISQPGKTVPLTFKLTNTGDPVIVRSRVDPFVAANEVGTVKRIDCEQTKIALCDSQKWFSALPSFFLNSSETQSIPVSLTIPKNTPPGDYTYTMLFSTILPPNAGKNGSRVSTQIGSNIIITVSNDGRITRQGRVVAFSALGGTSLGMGRLRMQLFDSFDTIPVLLRLENTGSTVIEPSTELVFSAPLFPTGVFNLPAQYVLSKSVRILKGNKTTKDANRLAFPASLILPRSLYLGRYTLKATISLAPGGPPIVVTTVFWALPIKLLSFLSLIGLILWLRRRGTWRNIILYINKSKAIIALHRFFRGKSP